MPLNPLELCSLYEAIRGTPVPETLVARKFGVNNLQDLPEDKLIEAMDYIRGLTRRVATEKRKWERSRARRGFTY